MTTHSSIFVWRIPWTEEPGELQSTGSQRVRHNWVTNTHSIARAYSSEPKEKIQRARSTTNKLPNRNLQHPHRYFVFMASVVVRRAHMENCQPRKLTWPWGLVLFGLHGTVSYWPSGSIQSLGPSSSWSSGWYQLAQSLNPLITG